MDVWEGFPYLGFQDPTFSIFTLTALNSLITLHFGEKTHGSRLDFRE